MITQTDIERGLARSHYLRSKAFTSGIAALRHGLRTSARALVALFT